MRVKASADTPAMSVIAIGFSSRSRAALEMAFTNRRFSRCEFVDDLAVAQVGIVDMDGP